MPKVVMSKVFSVLIFKFRVKILGEGKNNSLFTG